MTKKMLIEKKLDQVALDFESKSGIMGLTFRFVEKPVPYRGGETFCYYLISKVNDLMLGVMANNMKNVEIIIRMEEGQDEGTVHYDARFSYEHREGGSNGIAVMMADGSDRVWGIV